MPLELRWKLSGALRPFWYGRYEVNGRRYCSNLGVKIGGTPPSSMSLMDEGDAAFERSRAAALAKLGSIVEEARSKRNAEGLVEKLYEIKTGEKIQSTKLKSLAGEWAKLPRKRKPSARYLSQGQVTLKRFVDFVAQANSRVTEIAQVTRTLARAFMEAEAKRGVTGRTWNDVLSLLRTAFKALLPGGVVNPFMSVPMREADTMFRMAFTPAELAAIAEAARADEFIRPILITGMCTAMRRGDCCLLKWKDVDLERRFITVKTAKTRQTVSIPIFPMLEEELARRTVDGGQKPEDSSYVFPEQARMYLENPSGITWRVKKVLASALGEKLKSETPKLKMESGQRAEIGGQRSEDGSEKRKGETALPEVAVEEVERRGLDYVGGMANVARRERMTAVFRLYIGGKSLKQVAAERGLSKGSVSAYLKEIGEATGCRIVRGGPNGESVAARLKAQSHLLLAEREEGQRRASVRDFHSFRVTWVTLALTAGVPLELVQKVTGHKTTDIVLKHYFQPGREDFRKTLQSAMPKLLTNGQKSPKDEMHALIEEVKPKALRKRMLKVWEKW